MISKAVTFQANGIKSKSKSVKEQRLVSRLSTNYSFSWKLKHGSAYDLWPKSGTGLGKNHRNRRFHHCMEGNEILRNILPAGAYTHLLSTKQKWHLVIPTICFSERGPLDSRHWRQRFGCALLGVELSEKRNRISKIITGPARGEVD